MGCVVLCQARPILLRGKWQEKRQINGQENQNMSQLGAYLKVVVELNLKTMMNKPGLDGNHSWQAGSSFTMSAIKCGNELDLRGELCLNGGL